ncbi:toll-like receptor 13 isoform X2 [Gigantopelta aegis]|uniref:toll-like receptor 13 isoform X2 n=1 Tax=Gigantopelta aegis TaxID=1735272 RepID=UPI001B88BE77|nr:toll-like receptor 13 isoform X2 [Gigantopelta aegis]
MDLPSTVALVVLLVSRLGDVSSSRCSWSCKCYPKTKIAICGKTKPGIRRIPTVPGYVRYYTFSDGNIPALNRTALSPLANNSLLSLALLSDSIETLSADVFVDFQDLVMLDLSGNKIASSLLKSAFLSLGYELKSIILGNMNFGVIPHDLFETNKTLYVKKIIFSHNRLTSFNDSLLVLMPHLMQLDLGFNQISNYYNHYHNKYPNLRKIQLSHNLLREFPNFCWANGTIRYNRLESLDVSNNAILSLGSLSPTCIHNIKKIVLDGNRLTVLKNNTFSDLTQLVTLHLSSLRYLKVIEELAFNSTSLSILSLSYNVKMKPSMFPGKFPFIWAPKLSQLSLQETRLLLPLHLLRSLLLQLKSIRELNLQRTRINTLPPRTLCHLHYLKNLDLQGNYMARWDDETFSDVTQLNYLNLGGNRISVINETSFPVEFRTAIKAINLGNNDFLCTCALLWFRTWMNEVIKNKTIKFVNYPRKYYCKNPKHLRLDKFNPTADSCKTLNPYIIPFVSSGSIVLVVLIATIVIYRNRWTIRYCMYTKRKRSQYPPLLGGEHQLKYDAFVSFDSKDSDWMMEEVGNFLEGELELKLCIHERDFKVGGMIFDNIVECMDQSKKIILILSNNFVRSNWCKCELKLATKDKFETHKDVIVVIREMVDRKHMFKSLKALIDNTTYIEWSADESAKKLFRCRLAEVMGCEHGSVALM